MRVLISAYACEPGRGSEPGVGWTWVEMIASFADVTVLTRKNNREAIEAAAFVDDWVSRVDWRYFDLPRAFVDVKKRTGLVQPYYAAWQYCAIPLMKRIVREKEIQVVHHLTFGSYWMPSGAAWLDAPLVFGPVGGAESMSLSFAADRVGSLLFETLRTLSRMLAELEPSVRRAARRTVLAVAKAPETAERLVHLGATRVVIHSEVALPSATAAVGEQPPGMDRDIRIVSVGRLHHLKGYQLAFDALAACRDDIPHFSYTLVGEGPHRRFLERRVAQLGLGDAIAFVGRCSRSDVLETLASSDIFLHPSLHDSGGWACVEAMSVGLPVICLDTGGPSTQVTDATGVRIQMGSRKDVVRDIAAALTSLANHADLRHQMGRDGREAFEKNHSRAAQRAWVEDVYAALPLWSDRG